MHNKTNTLNSLKIGLLSLMFVLSNNAFAADSTYLEDITLPECDASNPEVQFISSDADWSKINDSSKRIFCVKPGNYGSVTLTADGTSTARRYIILDNGNNEHPQTLSEAEQANVKLNLNGANYWTIDRISNLHATTDIATTINGKSQYNILNRMNFSDFYKFGIMFMDGSNNNTIQQSRIADQSLAGRKADGVGISFIGEVWNSQSYVYNTKIVANEFKNCGDGIMLMRLWKDWDASIPVPTGYDGTIIDSNHIYISSDIYTDGSGNPTTSGNYAYAENAIDLKAGSDNPNNKVIITNNFMWGYRQSDTTGSNTNDPGSAVSIHYGVQNVVIENNYIFDSVRGISAGDAKGFSYGLSDAIISDNIFWSIHEFDLVLWASNNLTVARNIIHGATYWASFNGCYNSTLSDNVIIAAGGSTGSLSEGSTLSNTYFYSTTFDAQHVDLTFITDVYTSTPRKITLYGAAPTVDSPHYDALNFVAPVVETTPIVDTTPVVEEVTGPFIMDVNTKELK